MLSLRLAVQFVDGRTVNVTVPPIVQVAFERHFNIGIPEIGDKLHIEHLYWMAFETIRRDGNTPDDFDVWLTTVAALAEDDTAPVADPSTPTA